MGTPPPPCLHPSSVQDEIGSRPRPLLDQTARKKSGTSGGIVATRVVTATCHFPSLCVSVEGMDQLPLYLGGMQTGWECGLTIAPLATVLDPVGNSGGVLLTPEDIMIALASSWYGRRTIARLSVAAGGGSPFCDDDDADLEGLGDLPSSSFDGVASAFLPLPSRRVP